MVVLLVVMMQTWTNELLTWDPEDFCGIAFLSVPRQKLWKPDIVIAEK